MTTRTSATSGNWRADDADTWGLGLNNYPAAGEHVVIDTGHTVTLGESNDAGSIKLIGTLAGGGHTLTLNDGGDNEIFDHDGTITGTLNITITGTTNRLLDLAGSSGNVNNLTINASSTTFTLSGTGTHTVAGDLTLTAGTLDTGSTGIPMTVTGDVSVASGGTLDIDAASSDANYSFGSLTIASGGEVQAPSHGTITIKGNASSSSNLALNIDSNATFTHNGGTILFDGTNSFGGSSYGHFYFGDQTFNNITINASGKFIQPRKSGTTTLDIDGDLTITAGQLSNYNNNIIWDIAGDVDVSGTLGIADSTGAYSFGSLTINSGGTYTATSGTTTITDAYSSPFALNNSGTFTHNSGTLKLTRSGNQDFLGTWTGSSALYNLTIDCGGGSQQIRANMEIEGGLIITNGNFSTHTDNHDLTVVDLITVNGGTFTTNSSTINCGGIRNVGGTIA